MKLKTLAGLALALAAWSSFSTDLPTHEIISPEDRPVCPSGKIWDETTQQCIPHKITG